MSVSALHGADTHCAFLGGVGWEHRLLIIAQDVWTDFHHCQFPVIYESISKSKSSKREYGSYVFNIYQRLFSMSRKNHLAKLKHKEDL